VEATLNLIQGQKRFSDIPYFVQQQQHHHQEQQQQQQMQQLHQNYQLQQRLGAPGFYSGPTHPGFYSAGPFEPVCSIKQVPV
jgi:hypothetical protein